MNCIRCLGLCKGRKIVVSHGIGNEPHDAIMVQNMMQKYLYAVGGVEMKRNTYIPQSKCDLVYKTQTQSTNIKPRYRIHNMKQMNKLIQDIQNE